MYTAANTKQNAEWKYDKRLSKKCTESEYIQNKDVA